MKEDDGPYFFTQDMADGMSMGPTPITQQTPSPRSPLLFVDDIVVASCSGFMVLGRGPVVTDQSLAARTPSQHRKFPVPQRQNAHRRGRNR